MKLQCDLCREIVVADFVVAAGGAAGDAIEVHCPACDGRFRATGRNAPAVAAAPATTPMPMPVAALTRAARTSWQPPMGAPVMECPKCGEAQATGEACRMCGLKAPLMADYATKNPATDAPADVAAAWKAVEAAWSNVELHDRLANVVALHGDYAWIARRYREHLRADPTDAIAGDRLGRITRITEATLKATASLRRDRPAPITPGAPAAKPYRGVVTVLVMLIMVIIAGTIYALASTSDPPPDVAPIPITPAPPHR